MHVRASENSHAISSSSFATLLKSGTARTDIYSFVQGIDLEFHRLRQYTSEIHHIQCSFYSIAIFEVLTRGRKEGTTLGRR